MDERQKAFSALNSAGVEFALEEHKPVYTIEAVMETGLFDKCEVCKNLFICDDKGKRHYLFIAPGRKEISLKSLAERIGEKKIRFCSENRLMKYLGVQAGFVSPLALINDEDGEVTVILDADLRNYENLGFHPNDNSATCIISYFGLIKFLESRSNEIRIV